MSVQHQSFLTGFSNRTLTDAEEGTLLRKQSPHGGIGHYKQNRSSPGGRAVYQIGCLQEDKNTELIRHQVGAKLVSILLHRLQLVERI